MTSGRRDDGAPTSDWECLDLAHRGDEGAWQTLYIRHEGRLRRMATLITGSADSADDVAQETFVRVLRRKIPHRDGSFGAYLTTIAFRLALKEKVRLRKQGGFDEEAALGDTETPFEAAARSNRKKVVAALLETLPHDQREVIALRFFGGHSYDEIAGILGIPGGTVKSRIFYALKTCRREFRRVIPEKFPGEGNTDL